MCGYEKMHNRSFGFQGMVVEVFKWIELYGYRIYGEDSTIVQYKGSLGYVNVYHGRYSYEVGVEISPPGEGDMVTYSMSELIRLKDNILAITYRNPIAITPQTLEAFLADQSQRLKIYGQQIFAGDSAIWHELKHQRQQWSEEYAMNVLLSQVRPEAERSFRDHDYKRVVKLFSVVENRLSPTECKKLKYAREKLLIEGESP